MTMTKLGSDEIRARFHKKYDELLKTMQIEIRQQNENKQLFNLYLGFNNRPLTLHTMAIESKDEARLVAFAIIEMNKNIIPQITWITF
jgi:hypothetical protein